MKISQKRLLYALGILGIIFIVSILFWLFNDAISLWAVSANPFLVTIVNFLTNPFYIFSIFFVIEIYFKSFKLDRNFLNYLRLTVASIIFSLGIDIISILHTYNFNYVLTGGEATSIYFDTVIGKILFPILGNSGGFGTFVLYCIIPLIMFITSLLIASPKTFLGIVKKEFWN